MSAKLITASSLSTSQLAALAWAAADLRYKLSRRQREVFDLFKRELWGTGGYARPNGKQRRGILKLCRRFGKSFMCGVLACELCMSVPNARVYWAAETGKQVKKIILPNMRVILQDCPKELRPRWVGGDESCWKFPNGSVIYVAGCEDEARADRLRGDFANLFILDEAGHIDPLKYVYRSIALWMTARVNGRIIMPSSPAKSPAHAFTEYSQLAEAGVRGAYAHRDVYQSDLTPAEIEELAEECGGKETADWQREGLALDVVDSERAIIPEFAMRHAELTEDVQQPRWLDPMVSMDVGWSPDLTVALFGYWHFERACLVIEDEVVISRMTTDDLASGLRATEERNWGAYWDRCDEYGMLDDSYGGRHPYRRISDVDLQIICDLSLLHGMVFAATAKDHKEAAINQVRLLVKAGQIRINPRCKTLIAHLRAGVWNRARTSYERLDGFGHFDAIDALVYFVRNVDRQKDPAPVVDPMHKGDDMQVTKHVRAENSRRRAELETLRGMFTPRG